MNMIPRTVDLQRWQAIRARYEEGYGIGDVAKHFRIRRCTVRDIIIRLGGSLRPNGSRTRITPGLHAQILDLRRKRPDLTNQEIADTLDVGKTTVARYTRQAGLGRPSARNRFRPYIPAKPKPLRRRCPVDGCYDITTKPVCRNGHVVYEELTDE